MEDFLTRCNEYADGMLERYAGELGSSSGMLRLEVQDKISHWTAYKAFNEYTLSELDTSELDAWFEE